jgi:hypothetical protein
LVVRRSGFGFGGFGFELFFLFLFEGCGAAAVEVGFGLKVVVFLFAVHVLGNRPQGACFRLWMALDLLDEGDALIFVEGFRGGTGRRGGRRGFRHFGWSRFPFRGSRFRLDWGDP